MKKATFLILALALVLMLATPGSTAVAQSATTQTWTSSITYYTPSSTPGNMMVLYYSSDGTAISAGPFPLAAKKAGSLFIGSTSVPDGFAGSAIISADVPIIATYVQFASGEANTQYGRMLYNAFKANQSGSTFYVPTVLNKTFGSTSRIGVQNIESFEITANLKFYSVGSTTPTVNIDRDIKANSSFIFLPADVGLPTGFNGSLVITGSRKGEPGTPGRVVASAEETDDAGRGAYAFEGTASGANSVYMPSAMCNFGPEKQTSFYAIQNAGSINASVTIKYYNTTGAQVGSMPATTITAGGKLSRNPCLDNSLIGSLGSAVIESVGAPVIAIGKIRADNGMATAYVGESVGYNSVAAPYIRWSADPSAEWRAFVAIMNVGNANATNIVARYYDADGTLRGTHDVATSSNPLGQFIKRNTTAASAGALDSGGNFGISPFGGAVEITSDQPVVVVVRLQRDVNLGATTRFAEDYNGVDISP